MTTDTILVVLRRKRVEAEGICSFELVPRNGGDLPPFMAGAHVDVHLPGGLVRQYSLWGDPADRSVYRLGVLREADSRGGSAAMHEVLREGGELRISLPRNNFPLVEDASATLLVAGGIGITPLLAMARRLASLGRRFELHYSSRSRRRAAFLDWIEGSDLAARARLYHDDTGPRLDPEAVFSGRPDGTHVYVCGPAGFIGWILGAAQAAGIPERRLHREFFANPGRDASGGAFTVVLKRSGLTLLVPAGRSVADMLLAEGVDLPTSCEQGICGTCVTRVVEGIPDHRDEYLTDAEKARNDQFTPCCSRSLTDRLVLDL